MSRRREAGPLMQRRLPLPPAVCQTFVELLPSMGWDFTAAYAQVTGMKPGDASTRKAAAAFLSRPDVALLIRRRWSVSPDAKVTLEEANALLRALVYVDPGDFLTVDATTQRGRYLTVAEFKALPASVRRVVQHAELADLNGMPMDAVKVRLPSRLDAVKLLLGVGGLLGGEGVASAEQVASAVVDRMVEAAQRARARIEEAQKTITAKQLERPDAGVPSDV